MMMKSVLLLALVVAVQADLLLKKRQGDLWGEPSQEQDDSSDDDNDTDDDNSGEQDQDRGSGNKLGKLIEDVETLFGDLG